ncbi:ArfGAP with dual PH domains [Seminavis robusta]|uniref:ArfGAP with dual PH domains n=1 Tax=Seminavis robusta TaxID=568900 RepID=A0A9N8E9T8_9STRA|nr:ArfGAP with dual PH domains [Seminavis robusta]|eukprot:Sro786_g202230.1 ArfGAP with dual PH domains (553) ;mRNA; r:10324-12084
MVSTSVVSHRRRSSKAKKQAEMLQRLKACQELPENQKCAECGEDKPAWASLLKAPAALSSTTDKKKLGVFCCYKCCSYHFQMGRDICQVKNIKSSEDWTEDEVKTMEITGNGISNAIYEGLMDSCKQSVKPDPKNHEAQAQFVEDKYKELKFFCKEAYQAHGSWFTYQQKEQKRSSGSKKIKKEKSTSKCSSKCSSKCTSKSTSKGKSKSKPKDKAGRSHSRSRSSSEDVVSVPASSPPSPPPQDDESPAGKKEQLVVVDASSKHSTLDGVHSDLSETEDSFSDDDDDSCCHRSSSLSDTMKAQALFHHQHRKGPHELRLEQDAKQMQPGYSSYSGGSRNHLLPSDVDLGYGSDHHRTHDESDLGYETNHVDLGYGNDDDDDQSVDGTLANQLARRSISSGGRIRRGSLGCGGSSHSRRGSRVESSSQHRDSIGHNHSNHHRDSIGYHSNHQGSTPGRRPSMVRTSSRRRVARQNSSLRCRESVGPRRESIGSRRDSIGSRRESMGHRSNSRRQIQQCPSTGAVLEGERSATGRKRHHGRRGSMGGSALLVH